MNKIEKQYERKGVIYLVLLTFNFGLIAILARFLSFYLTLCQQLYLTVGIAFLFGLVIFKKDLHYEKLKKIPFRDWFILAVRAIFGYVLGGLLYREALTLTKISNVTFIQSIPFAAILGFILFGEKLTVKKVLYVILAFAGVMLIAVKDFSSLFIWGKGEIFSLISTFLFSFAFLARRWLSNFLNNQEMSQIALFIGFVILFGLSLINAELIPVFPINGGLLFIVALFLLSFINTIDGLLINFGFKHVPHVLASNILTLESVFALGLAFIFYREIPLVKECIGGILIIGSVIQMNKLEEKREM